MVHLYARFGDEPYEDGSDIAYAFVLTETPRQLTLDAWQTTYFAFTPEESGRYTLVLPFDWVAYSGSGCGTYDAATDTLSIFYPSYDRDEDGNITTGLGYDGGADLLFLLQTSWIRTCSPGRAACPPSPARWR